MIEKQEIEWAKETGDHGEILKEISRGIAEKKSLIEIASSLPDEVMEAINGADQTDDEFRENLPVVAATIGYQLGYSLGLILQKRAEPKDEAPVEGDAQA